MKKNKWFYFYIYALFVISIGIGCFNWINGKEKVMIIAFNFLVLSSIPHFLQRFFKVKISKFLYSSWVSLVFMALFLGGGLRFYKMFFWWDNVVHFLSGMVSFLIGFDICKALKVKHERRFLLILLITIAIALGWELFEFVYDSIFKTNLQEWKNHTFEPFVPYVKERGHGLADSMMDMVYAIIGYIVSLCVYYCYRSFLKDNSK